MVQEAVQEIKGDAGDQRGRSSFLAFLFDLALEKSCVLAPGQAWERGKRCKDTKLKPFVGTLWVTNPTRQSWLAAGSECCVLLRAIDGTKRTQRVPRPCY